MQSKDEAYDMSPCRDKSPKVGFRPTTPQKEAGCLMDPVGKDMVHGTRPIEREDGNLQYRYPKLQYTGAGQQLRQILQMNLLGLGDVPKGFE